MLFTETSSTVKIKALDKRIRLLAGGMRASKTISVLLYLIAKAQTDYDCTNCKKHGCTAPSHHKSWVMRPTLTSIVSESFPHLRKGAMRDFLTILEGHNYYDDSRWHKTDSIYTFETGSKIEFFSADQPGRIRGPSRDRLFVNEANNISQESWEQLLFRTREFAFADWNPVGDFYLYEDYGLTDEDGAASTDDRVDFLILTYKDNQALEPTIVEDIERKAKLNPSWARVYAEGKRGQLEGKIYKNWAIIPEVPHEARLERRGLDFGYSNDPTAVISVYYYNGGYIWDEELHQKGMSNKQIADLLSNLDAPHTMVVADSAEPKSIDELKQYGINVIGANKGQGSVNQGIQYVQDQKISMTTRSTNLIKAYRNYMWKTDKEGKLLNEPDHFMSDPMDAGRYAMESLRPNLNAVQAYKPADMLAKKRQNMTYVRAGSR